MKTLKECVNEIAETARCNCDLDNWEPERDTGHSYVCRIHKMAKVRFRNQANDGGQAR